MEAYLIIAVVAVAVVFLVFAVSGPRSEAKVIEDVTRLDDNSLINEFNRVHRWIERYSSLDHEWKKKAATPEVHDKYERYYKDICQERNRRYFFQELRNHIPELKLLSSTSYGDALNDSMTNIAWSMKNKGATTDEVVAWYRKKQTRHP